MRKLLCRAFLASTLSLLLALPQPAFAWGNQGHEAVAWVAWQQLTPATKLRVLALLKKVPALSDEIPGYAEWVSQLPTGLSTDLQNEYLFMRAATWADSIKHHGLKDSDTPPPGITTDVNIGFSDDASHGYWHFIDTAFASDAESTPSTPIPNVATQIAALRTDNASSEGDTLKAYDMIWLLHLVGDIHQPLHATVRYDGGSGDAGGNLVKIKLPTTLFTTFKCPTSKFYAPRELHALWDDLPGSCPAETALAPAAAFAKALPKKSDSSTDPDQWAKESFDLAESDAYASPIGPTIQPEDGTTSYVITKAYYDKAMADAKDRIALAGTRLANLLNDNLK